MAQWAVVLSPERYEAERLYHHETLELDRPAGAGSSPAPGDQVLVLAGQAQPVVVALGRIVGDEPGGAGGPTDAGRAAGANGGGRAAGANGGGRAALTVAYTRRTFDAPVPAVGVSLDRGLTLVDPAAYQAVVDRLPATDVRTWLVSVDLPIEADSPAEAVRRFWSYVRELGPRELPAFVAPTGDELAMQAFVLGEEANLDPEEDEDD